MNGRTVRKPSMSYLNDPKHWLDRAEKTRAKAHLMRYDEELRQRLLRIAREYDRLAEHAAEHAKASPLLEENSRPVQYWQSH